MGQVPLLIITDIQLERQKVQKNPDLPLGGMMGGRQAKRTMPDFLLRELLTYELEQDPGAHINWSQELGLNS